MNKQVLALCVGVLIASCSEKKDTFQRTASPPPVVDVMVAEKRSISADLELNGSIVPNDFLELMPETNGRLVYLNVPEGKQVSKGTVIARINDADLQAQLRKSAVQLEMAELSEQRLKKLLEVNGVNQADYDLALNQVNSLKADLEITQALIDKTVIKAPFDGVVGLRQVSNGAIVTTATILATIQATNPLKVDFNVPEEYIGYVRKGATVDVQIDKGDGRLEKAQIIATEPQIDVTSRNVTVRGILGNSKASPGSFAKVYLKLGGEHNSIMVPTNSIIPEAKTKKVVVVKNGLATLVSVVTGVRQTDLVEITSGLAVGDTVVVSGVLFARPGRPVRIRNVASLHQVPEE